MTDWVKQSAWLNTVPEKSKQPRRATKTVPMPKVAGGAYLLEIMFEIGPTKPTGMGGSIGIDENDLIAWQANQQVQLRPWEAKAIRMLSREYAAMQMQAVDPKCPQPYHGKLEISADQRAAISEAMSNWSVKFTNQRNKR